MRRERGNGLPSGDDKPLPLISMSERTITNALSYTLHSYFNSTHSVRGSKRGTDTRLTRLNMLSKGFMTASLGIHEIVRLKLFP